MLVHLHVKNLALIEETEVEFGPGLNILTGETGAGKSILLGSIQLILGGKTSRSMIRENASYALVELLFQVENTKAKEALAALDALLRVNVAFAVDEGDRALGADLLAGGGQTVLAVLRHPVLVGGAGVAGIGNDVDQRRLVILLGNGGGIHALGHQTAGLDGADGQAHGEPYPLTRDGAFQENRLPVQGLVAGDDLEGQVLRSLVAVAAVCHAGDLGKYLFANIRDQRRNSSHVTASNFDK